MKKIILIIVGLALGVPLIVGARIGVGVGTGKIYVNEKLRAGVIYDLPPFTVLNTGDELGNYGASVEYNEVQPQLKPASEWFSFEPSNFTLGPGQVQIVQVRLSLPVKDVKPGDYFVYLEGHPIKKSVSGETSIGVAAAAKLYFTVAPANLLIGVYYRVLSLVLLYSPWSYVAIGAIIMIVLVTLFRRFFAFNVGISIKK